MLTEKKWPSVILNPIQVADSVITVADVYGLHPKQQITLFKTGLDPLECEVKRIISKTQFYVGEIGGKISKYLNPTEYDGGSITVSEQERNTVDANAGIRAAYAEEPTVALRNALVDYYGNYIDSEVTDDGKNALVVAAQIDIPFGFKPKKYDQVSLERDSQTKDIVHAKFYYRSVLQKDLLLTYDIDDDLIDVREV
jgi:hypothetical protein